MPKPKIDRIKLSQYLKSGKTQREIAQVFGVTESAISKARKELNLNVVKNVALENAGRIVQAPYPCLWSSPQRFAERHLAAQVFHHSAGYCVADLLVDFRGSGVFEVDSDVGKRL